MMLAHSQRLRMMLMPVAKSQAESKSAEVVVLVVRPSLAHQLEGAAHSVYLVLHCEGTGERALPCRWECTVGHA